MKKLFYSLILILFTTSLATAHITPKILTLQKTDDNILIDGIIDPAWNQADSISDFIQFQPYHGTDPTTKTVAKVLTTEEAIYCLMVCYENKKNRKHD